MHVSQVMLRKKKLKPNSAREFFRNGNIEDYNLAIDYIIKSGEKSDIFRQIDDKIKNKSWTYRLCSF